MSASAIGGRTGSRSGKPFRSANPDMASTSVPNPGRSRYGPVWPNPETRTMIRPGLSACRTSGASPISSNRPGMKFSTSTSASLASRRTSACPSGSRRLTDTLFLFRQYVFQCVSTELSPQARSGSPLGSGSILTTSAPKSPSWRVSMFPATSRDMSSTRRPSSGPRSSGSNCLAWIAIPRRLLSLRLWCPAVGGGLVAVYRRVWWGCRDSNPDAVGHMILSHARLPVPTHPHGHRWTHAGALVGEW